jgi:hypothetical protein
MAQVGVDHYLPLFGRDFLAATAGWTAEERGHYITALIVQWEQGSIPDPFDRLEIMSPGIGRCWVILEPKFPVGQDGRRRNAKLEEHRAKVEALKLARAEAGRLGNEARWGRRPIANGSQTDRKAIARGIADFSQVGPQAAAEADLVAPNPAESDSLCESRQSGSQNDRKRIANGIAKGSPPTPNPNREELHTHTQTAIHHFGEPGWAADEWSRFASAWNRTERAEPWTHLTAPGGWVDLAASPGWLDRAHAALAMLPGCAFFDTPLPVTRFFAYVDRILAREFRGAKAERGGKRKPVGGNL